MNNISRHHLLHILLVLMLAVGLAGCSDDDNPVVINDDFGTGVIGTWVTYNALDSGVPEPDGGTYGVGGTVITIIAGGAGHSMDPEDIGTLEPFTWTQEGTTFTVTQGGETWNMTAEVAGNTLTISDVGGFVTIYQRYIGPGVLVGTWSILSVVDDFAGGQLEVDPGDFSYRFNSDGSINYIVDGTVVDSATYSTDGPVLSMVSGGPVEDGIFAVVGSNLYIFLFSPDSGMVGDEMFIMKFIKI